MDLLAIKIQRPIHLCQIAIFRPFLVQPNLSVSYSFVWFVVYAVCVNRRYYISEAVFFIYLFIFLFKIK